MAVLFALHLVGSIVVGWAGRNRRYGFLGFFLPSLFLSPILPLLFLILTAPREHPYEMSRQ